MFNVFERTRTLSRTVSVVAVLVLTGCGGGRDPHCLELAKGNRFEIAIEGVDSECASGFLGLAPGRTLLATVREFTPPWRDSGCSPAFVELEALDDPDGRWTPKTPSQPNDYGGRYIFRRGECRSEVLLNGSGAPVGTLAISSAPGEVEGGTECAEPCMATASVRLTPR
jgi:hypothetical protein